MQMQAPPPTCISNFYSIFSAQVSNMGNIQHLARTQNSGKADTYFDFSTYPLHSTYPPYAPKGQQSYMESSKQCTAVQL